MSNDLIARLRNLVGEIPLSSTDRLRIEAAIALEAQAREIEALRELLSLANGECQNLHHTRKDQHKLGEPCPVERRINDAIKAVTP
jgi:hypothetical protein